MFMKAAAPLLKNKLPAKAIDYMQNPNAPNAEYNLVRGLFTDEELQSLGWNPTIENSKFKIQNLTDAVISKRAGDLEICIRSSTVKHCTSTTNDPMTTNAASMTTNDYLSPLQYVSMMETCYYMRNQLLRDSDIFSMAHSLELRVPFVDHLLYSAVLPYLDSAFNKNYPKKMLVDAVGDIPLELINRPKMGFTFPFADWIRKDN